VTGSDELDVTEVKSIVARWIEEFTLLGDHLPVLMTAELLDQLARAPVVITREGTILLELPALATLGLGIFRRTFPLRDLVICVAPYLPAGVALSALSPLSVEDPRPATWRSGEPPARGRGRF
jgi:hypothetical protein